MPRKRNERKIGRHTPEQMKYALSVIKNGTSIKKAAKLAGIPFTTLWRYHINNKNLPVTQITKLVPNYSVNQIFTDAQEKILKEYLVHCALIFYGLTSKETRIVAYQMACVNNFKMPTSCRRDGMAGKGWLRSFRKRHNDLSIRKPEPCSLARATAFNRANVMNFFNNVENLMKRNPSLADGTRIYNLDETSTTTVQKPQKVVASKGRKSLGKVTSGEKGTLVTTCCTIGANGIALPPVMVFPRKNYKDYVCKGTPAGTLGLAAPSGWMNSELFSQVMQHFIKHSNSSPTNPCILIMDNHESHLCIEALNLAKSAGVHILTLHPHTSGKLQPLDVGIFAPFKGYYYAAMESWMLRNPGKPLTIYDIGEIVGIAFNKVMTPLNITNAFKKCGIFPFDRDIFDDLDFLPSSVTDRPCPDCEAREDPDDMEDETDPSKSGVRAEFLPNNNEREETISNVQKIPTTSIISNRRLSSAPSTEVFDADRFLQLKDNDLTTSDIPDSPSIIDFTENDSMQITPQNSPVPSSSKDKESFVSPFEFRNAIKAGPRKPNRKPRKLGKSLIATDTPVKNEIEEERAKAKKTKMLKDKKTSKKLMQSDSEEDIEYQVLLQDDSDNDWIEDDEKENEEQVTEDDLKHPLPRRPHEGDYVLVEFSTKKQKIYYIGKVIESRNKSLEYFISFLRRKSIGKFHLPNVPDLSLTKEQDIKIILSPPTLSGSTSR